MPPNRFESEVESFLEGSHGDRTHIKRADHHTVTPLCGTLLAEPLGVCSPGACGCSGDPLGDWSTALRGSHHCRIGSATGNYVEYRVVPYQAASPKPHLMTPPASQGCRCWGLMRGVWHHQDRRRRGPRELTGIVDLTRGKDHPTARLSGPGPGKVWHRA